MYTIQVKPAFERAFDKLTRKDRALAVRLTAAIDELRRDPRPDGHRKLAGVRDGDDELYRVRVGAYRIIYAIRDRQLVIMLVSVDDRKNVYR